jgi:hypothetical protein
MVGGGGRTGLPRFSCSSNISTTSWLGCFDLDRELLVGKVLVGAISKSSRMASARAGISRSERFFRGRRARLASTLRFEAGIISPLWGCEDDGRKFVPLKAVWLKGLVWLRVFSRDDWRVDSGALSSLSFAYLSPATARVLRIGPARRNRGGGGISSASFFFLFSSALVSLPD